MLAPSGGGLIHYQAYGNLYAMTDVERFKLQKKINLRIAFENADFEFKSRVDTFKDKECAIRLSSAFIQEFSVISNFKDKEND
ncbi:hypothetical protein Tco_1229774 [Tanacetum coccineum]